jgi:hypothetical protein
MPITLSCPCGKPLRVADQYAGKKVKCPICGAIQTAGEPAASSPIAQAAAPKQPESTDDFEILEETAPAPMELPPEPVHAPAPAAKPRLKASIAEEPSPRPAAPAKPKKKKRKKSAAPQEGDDDWYERMRDNEAKMRRILRGSAFLVLGLIILAGVSILWFGYREDVKWLQESGGRAVVGLLLLTVIGLAAVAKGAIGLAFGQFLGEDD